MEILNQMQNGNFEIIDKNKIKNVHTGEIIKGATQLLNDYMGDHVLIETYSSGVLAVRKQSYQIDIKFIKNNGDALIDLSLDDLNEMDNKIYDVNAIVCSSGVLVAYNFLRAIGTFITLTAAPKSPRVTLTTFAPASPISRPTPPQPTPTPLPPSPQPKNKRKRNISQGALR